LTTLKPATDKIILTGIYGIRLFGIFEMKETHQDGWWAGEDCNEIDA